MEPMVGGLGRQIAKYGGSPEASPRTMMHHELSASPKSAPRPHARGKFLFIGDEKFYVRGATYGTFGGGYGPEAVERDFARMAANGLNAVRTYDAPPRLLLDAARRHGLYVMVGLAWEQHVAFLDDGGGRARRIEARVREEVRACAGHPAVLCYAVGNEIPAPIARWHGRRRIERFIERLCVAAQEEDPEGLVTYVNYPSTEYLRLPFVDFVSFNVYLEERGDFEAYLARLHNVADGKPLVMAEIGLDSRSNGRLAQARSLEWQIRSSFASGCAGAFVFAWTDEWSRSGCDIEDWDFGLTGRDRRPKPSLAAVREALAEAPLPASVPRPRVSVVVCSRNGARTIRDSLEGLARVEYPDYEVIVVDDGSTDETAAIAGEYEVRLIRTENRGLSNARNTGMEAAAGDIVAYIDDDARPDPQWLTYLAHAFMDTSHAAVGGPNIAPRGDGMVADCVDNAPGNPVCILLSDGEAEHLAGCNMAFRKDALEKIGGFDPRFRVAGDDVDVCWRLRERGGTLGFSHAAVVWHHRRGSVGAYFRQQKGYGEAEALLEKKWPEKYNAAGHLLWAGRVYGKGLARAFGWRREKVRHGMWGAGLFQSVYERSPGLFTSLPLMPEWALISVSLLALSALAIVCEPLLVALPLLALAVGLSLAQATASAAGACFPNTPRTRLVRLGMFGATAFLHLLQPLARLYGRLRHGLAPWRRGASFGLRVPHPRKLAVWSGKWRASEAWLRSIEGTLREAGARVLRGGEFDRWDLEARGGMLGGVRARMAVEEHGEGKQLARFHTWPRCSLVGLAVAGAFAVLAVVEGFEGAWLDFAVLGGVAAILVSRTAWECAAAMRLAVRAIEKEGGR